MLLVAGYDGLFKFINPAWTQTLGYSQAELMARPFLEVERLATGAKTVNFRNRYGNCRGSIVGMNEIGRFG